MVYNGTHKGGNPMRKKTRLNIYLEPPQKEKLDKLSKKTGAPLSELVRRAVEAYLKKEA
jgi:predicted DNA-binding protein